MRYFHSPKQRFLMSAVLLVWFFIWGVCPWDNNSAAAQPLLTAHVQHGHQGMDDTHHASKGGEHSCSGAASLSKEQSSWEKVSQSLNPQNDSPVSIIALSRFYRFYHLFHFPLRFLKVQAFSKRFSNLYQINLSLRL